MSQLSASVGGKDILNQALVEGEYHRARSDVLVEKVDQGGPLRPAWLHELFQPGAHPADADKQSQRDQIGGIG